MFEALAEAGINIQMITTSEIKISVLVDRASAAAALRAVHQAFLLDRLERRVGPAVRRHRARPRVASSPRRPTRGRVRRPRRGRAGMEDLVISGVELDESQARITLFDVPDQPGYAAPRLPRDRRGRRLRRHDRAERQHGGQHAPVVHRPPRRGRARRRGRRARSGAGEVSVEPTMAKLSVLGVGMRTHTGVATRMFGALAERGINITLINTSEVRINVATDIARGREGLDCLRRTFALLDDE